MQTDNERLMAQIMKAKAGPGFIMADPRWSALFKDNSTFQQSGSATSGLTFYDLEPGAKFLYPVPTPLRNMTPRVSGKGGIEADWRSITAINTANLSPGVSGGNRGGILAVTTTNNSASYKGLGLEGFVSFEAQYAGQGFDDIRAINARVTLESLMIQEEKCILGGNPSLALGTTPTPTLADVASGGSLNASSTYYVQCVALSFDGVTNGTVSAAGVPGAVTRVNADSSSDTYGGGSAAPSVQASQATSGSGGNAHSITASVTAVKGAMGYAWYIGTVSGTCYLAAITAANAYTFTAAPVTSNQVASTLSGDNSTNTLLFSGLLYQALASTSNSYTSAQSGTLTADGAGGVVEIDTMLKSFWDNYRLGPNDIWVNSQQALDITKKILATTSGNPGAQRFTIVADQAGLIGGMIIRSYLNKFTNETINIRIHPNMPAGVILATASKIPYPLSGVGNVFQIRARQDYYEIDWPLVTRKWQMGVYCDEVLQHYFPPSMGVIYNITAG